MGDGAATLLSTPEARLAPALISCVSLPEIRMGLVARKSATGALQPVTAINEFHRLITFILPSLEVHLLSAVLHSKIDWIKNDVWFKKKKKSQCNFTRSLY